MPNGRTLTPLEPCFGTKARPFAKKLHYLRRQGKPAVGLARTLATTPTRKTQIQTALNKCRNLWQQGYGDKE